MRNYEPLPFEHVERLGVGSSTNQRIVLFCDHGARTTRFPIGKNIPASVRIRTKTLSAAC